MEMGESQSSQNDEKIRVKEAVMTREAITAAQIHHLLSVAGTMASIAHRHPTLDEDENETLPAKTEAQIAAENTFINACSVLDQILADPMRWDLSFQQQQEKVFQAQQLATVNRRIRDLEECDLPHVRFSPSLYRTVDGKWMALLGDPDSPGSGVTGIGNSPQEAINNFDATFLGRAVTIDPVKWAEELNSKATHEQHKLDRSGAGQDSRNETDGSYLGTGCSSAAGPESGWVPDNLGQDQGRDASDDGAFGAGKPA